MLAALAPVLEGRAAPRVGLLLDGKERPAVGAIERRWPRAELTRIDVRVEVPRTHVALAAHGPYDAVVDLVPRGAERRMAHLAGHVVAGGIWVARTPAGLATRAVGESLVAVVRDAEAAEVLDLAPARGRVLARLEGARWQVRGRVRTSAAHDVNPLPDHYDAPPMFLREYADALCLPRQVVVQGSLVLPETFTTVEDHRQRNAALANRGVDFAEDPRGADAEEAERLAGRWFHLDNHLLWHFGHAVTEQVSHLWGWARAYAADPDLRALVQAPSGQLAAWQRDLLAAGGVPPHAIRVATGPVRVERLVGATPMLSRPAFAHPDLLATWEGIGAALSRAAGPGERPRRIFLDRRGSKRICRNAEDLVAEFTGAGFEVVHPEDLPLADQVELVRRADMVAGFAGSAMFHLAFAGSPKQVVVVGSESYPAHNETLIGALAGHDLALVLCEPDVPRVGGRWTKESFHSDFTYRPEREGVFLRAVLAGPDR